MEDMKDLVLNYVIKEYMEDGDEVITYDTPLISSGYVDSFSMVSLLVFLVNSIVALVKQYLK
jgi:acyl carrier protein